MQGRERAINTLSVRRPQPHNTNQLNERESKKQQETNRERVPRLIKRHWFCSWNPPVPHHRIRGHQYRSTKILTGEQKSCGTARFYSEEAHKCTDVHHSVAWNLHRHIRHRYSTIKRVHRVKPLILFSIHKTATDRTCARSHSNAPQSKNWHHWLHGRVV